MAEFLAVVSIASNFASVIQIGGQVLTACYAYYQAVHDAKADIERIVGVVAGLKGVLEELRDLVNVKPADQTDPVLDPFLEPLKQCDEALRLLGRELGKGVGMSIEEMTKSNQVKLGFPMKGRWPFKSKDAEKILARIEAHKTTFILAASASALG
jgi:hypothetical protein